MTNPTISHLLELAREAESSRVGYDQGQRTSWLDVANRRIIPGRETDCSHLTLGLYWLAGWPIPHVAEGRVAYTGNFEDLCRRAGFEITNVAGWSLQRIISHLRPGDSLLGPGHVILVGDGGRWLSAEYDERGRSQGGQAGDQTGTEVRWRSPYMRSKGWTRICRPPVSSEIPVADELAAVTPSAPTPTPAPGPAPVAGNPYLPLDVDGAWGRKTTSALQWALRSRNARGLNGGHLEIDGQLGGHTYRALQIILNQLGGNKLRLTGRFGVLSRRALQRFLGVGVDGIIGPNTTRALQSALNNGKI